MKVLISLLKSYRKCLNGLIVWKKNGKQKKQFFNIDNNNLKMFLEQQISILDDFWRIMW